jgi:hypothetical protein
VGNHDSVQSVGSQTYLLDTTGVLTLRTYLQGFYVNGTLLKTLRFKGAGFTSSPYCDSVIVECRSSVSPYSVVYSSRCILDTNGYITFVYPASLLTDDYYIAIKHRNSLETWSSTPIELYTTSNYDFTTSASAAYGSNQVEVDPGIWAFYSGDLNGDENVDLIDISRVELEVNNFSFGYNSSDINGDGNVDLLDTPLLETNVNNFIFSMHP